MKLTEAVVVQALRKRYAGNEWAFLAQVRSSTGFTAGVARTADAMAFNLWPSRGLEIHGFEVKVSRADWLSELKTPEKAETIARYCDRWWMVAPNGIIRKEELPPLWGLLELEGESTLKITKEAGKNPSPVVPPRSFWMAVMRANAEQVDPYATKEQEVATARGEGYKKGAEAEKKHYETMLRMAEERFANAEKERDLARGELTDVLRVLGATQYNWKRLPLREAMALLQNPQLQEQLKIIQYNLGALQRSMAELGDLPPGEKT